MRNTTQMKALKRSALTVLALALLLAAERTFAVMTSQPQIEGTVTVTGLTSDAEIIRDAHGVPHIYGATDEDVAFGLGFAHAQDRLWQMEFSRRLATGRLSEIMGSSTVGFDKFFRSLALSEPIVKSFRTLVPKTQAMLQAYSAGVNAAMDDPQTPVPPEFSLLYHSPEPWTVYDSLLIPKLMSLSLSTNMFHEIRRAQLLKTLGPEKLDMFYPDAPVKTSELPQELLSLYQDLSSNSLALSVLDAWQRGASNNWVVDGRHTESGMPLLANDPHLELGSPSIWYLAHMSLQDGPVIGATIAGLPSIILGRNNRIAWGFTNTGADVQDLFIEKINPDNPDEYLTPTGYQRFESRDEIIRVRFGADIPIKVRKTRHGVVMPQNWLQSDDILGPRHVLSLSWTALADDDKTADASIAVMQSKTWNAFVRATQSMDHPMQSIVYGDVDGHIGFIAPAKVPIRKTANKLYGMLPAPGWDDTYDWDGFIPFQELPQRFDPESGKIFTANDKIVSDDYPFWITHLWEHEHRVNRISDLLSQTSQHRSNTFIDMQKDTFSPDTVDLIPYLTALETGTALERDALDIVRDWDGRMDKDSAAPTIYTAWLAELAKQIYADDLGEQFYRHWELKIDFIADALANRNGIAVWCDDLTTEQVEDCRSLSKTALTESMAMLADRYGADPHDWTWGRAHTAVHMHNPFGQIPFLKTIFNLHVASDGGFYTLNRGGHRLASQEPFGNIHGSGYRAVYDFADLNNSVFMQSTGQSGNPVSPFFATFVQTWADVGYIPMTTNRAHILENASGRLILTVDTPG